MGAWGAGVFEDDTALDVRGSFEAALEEGSSVEEATQRVLREYASDLLDPDYGPIVWLALAGTQLEHGVLQPEVRDRALSVIDEGQGLDPWAEGGPSDDLLERKQALQEFKVKLLEPAPKRRTRKKRVKLKVGDCFVIPLPDGRNAYGQLVYWHTGPGGYGTLVRVFDLFTEDVVPVEQLRDARQLFPPVFTAAQGAVNEERWRVIGSLPVEGFVFPKFRYLRTLNKRPGVYHDWWVWDGLQDIYVGDLTPEYRSLEYPVIWSVDNIERRIATGVNWYDQLQ